MPLKQWILCLKVFEGKLTYRKFPLALRLLSPQAPAALVT